MVLVILTLASGAVGQGGPGGKTIAVNGEFTLRRRSLIIRTLDSSRLSDLSVTSGFFAHNTRYWEAENSDASCKAKAYGKACFPWPNNFPKLACPPPGSP
jgi:hypothetical protein